MGHWMRRWVWWTLWLGIVVVVASQPALAQQERVAVCHHSPDNPENFHILYVAPQAVAEHLTHGDNLVHPEGGHSQDTCTDGIDNDCNGLIDSADPHCPPNCHPDLTPGCTPETAATYCCSEVCFIPPVPPGGDPFCAVPAQ
jgi:hypothetical protein